VEDEDGIESCIAELESQASRFPSLPVPKRDEYATRLRALASEVSYTIELKKAAPPAETTRPKQPGASPWIVALYLIVLLAGIIGVGAAMSNGETDEILLNPVKFFARTFGYAWIVFVLGIGVEVVVWVVFSINWAFKNRA
jgi:hypothetical protein